MEEEEAEANDDGRNGCPPTLETEAAPMRSTGRLVEEDREARSLRRCCLLEAAGATAAPPAAAPPSTSVKPPPCAAAASSASSQASPNGTGIGELNKKKRENATPSLTGSTSLEITFPQSINLILIFSKTYQ